MSRDRRPPPDHEACLVRLRPSSQKGGTIIAEDVTDRATHDRRICNPDRLRDTRRNLDRVPGASQSRRWKGGRAAVRPVTTPHEPHLRI